MAKEPENEEEREASENVERQEFYNESYKKMQNREIHVYSGGDGTFLNKAMFDYFNLDDELDYTEKEKKLKEQIREDALAEEKKRELYDAVKAKVDGALKAGNLKDVDPVPHDSDENSVSYKVDGHSLDQKDLGDGMFEFSPGGQFTGVLRVERTDSNGELLPDSVDIIEYKNGKPVSVIPGPEGKTRVADFGLLSQQAGISVSRFQDTGISVSKVKDESPHQSASKDVNPPTAAPHEDLSKEANPPTAAETGPKAIKDSPSKSGPIVKADQNIDIESLKFIANIIKERVKFDDLPRERQLAMNETFKAVINGMKSGEIKPIVIKLPEEKKTTKALGWKHDESSKKKGRDSLSPEEKTMLDVATVTTYSVAIQAFNNGLITKKHLDSMCSDIEGLAPEALHKVAPDRFPLKGGVDKFVGQSLEVGKVNSNLKSLPGVKHEKGKGGGQER